MNGDWIIEHVSLGVYLGDGRHPRNGARIPLFRADGRDQPCSRFVSVIAAEVEMERICSAKYRPVAPVMLAIVKA